MKKKFLRVHVALIIIAIVAWLYYLVVSAPRIEDNRFDDNSTIDDLKNELYSIENLVSVDFETDSEIFYIQVNLSDYTEKLQDDIYYIIYDYFHYESTVEIIGDRKIVINYYEDDKHQAMMTSIGSKYEIGTKFRYGE